MKNLEYIFGIFLLVGLVETLKTNLFVTFLTVNKETVMVLEIYKKS